MSSFCAMGLTLSSFHSVALCSLLILFYPSASLKLPPHIKLTLTVEKCLLKR
jgi:hypothetical protein